MGKQLIIIGASARAAAQSAIRGGYEPWCADLFADRDLQKVATVHRCLPEQYPQALAKLIDEGSLPLDVAVLYTGGLENEPQLIEAIAFDRPLLGCSPYALRRVRDPLALPSLPRHRGIRFCKMHRHRPLLSWLFPSLLNKYLIKPCQGTGGRGIRRWSLAERVARTDYLQQYVPGRPVSMVYVGDGWSARLLGVTEQLIGDKSFGGDGYRYCGSIGPLMLEKAQQAAMVHLGVQLAQRFDLRGPFGVDAIIARRRGGAIWPVEVNPRYTASIEVIERTTGLNSLGKDLAVRKMRSRSDAEIMGKAVVFARKHVSAPDLYQWFDAEQIADVPQIGEPIRQGHPVCTVFAHATDVSRCRTRLRQLAQTLYTRLDT